eukprot:455376_1
MESNQNITISYTTKSTKTTASLTGTETTNCVCECGQKMKFNISKIEQLNANKVKKNAKCYDGGLDRHIDSKKHKDALREKIKPKSTITNWFKKKDTNSNTTNNSTNTNNNSNTTNNSSNTNNNATKRTFQQINSSEDDNNDNDNHNNQPFKKK